MSGVSVAANSAVVSLNGTHTIAKSPGTKDKRYIRVVEPEKTDGSTEYKRQLLQCTPNRLEKLKTQMSFRLDQGDGCCVYRIGVEDDGCHSLIDYPACAETARILEYLARSLNAVVVDRTMIQNEVVVEGTTAPNQSKSQIVVAREDSLLGDGKEQLFEDQDNSEAKNDSSKASESSLLNKNQGVYTRCNLTIHRVETHLLDPSPIAEDAKIRRTAKGTSSKAATSETKTDDQPQPLSVGETLSTRNLRVAVVGNVDAGKSTMIGTLTSSLLDDGRGSSRTSIMKHRHEIESGRTSTASSHLLGFLQTGQAIAGKGDSVRAHRRKSDDEIARESYRVVTLMDLAGHEKYLKTTCVTNEQ